MMRGVLAVGSAVRRSPPPVARVLQVGQLGIVDALVTIREIEVV